MRRQLATLLAFLAVLSFSASPVLAAADRPLVMEAGQTKQLPASTTLQTSAGTTGAASVNLPHGAAPTAPVNGDLWTTTSGFFGRVNGSTVGPFSSGSGTPGGSSGQIQYNNAGAFGGASVSGDCTAAILVFTCSKLSGVLPGYFFDGTDAANLTGTVSVNRFNGGTSASSATFLRGDGTWVTPTGGAGTVTHTGSLTSGQLIKGNGSADITVGDLTGDVTTSGGMATTLATVATAGTNTKVTYNAKGLVTSGAAATLASADFVNQGTTTTVLHGNAAGNPSWGAVSLANDVTGDLGVTHLNGGTSASSATFWRGDGTWGSIGAGALANPFCYASSGPCYRWGSGAPSATTDPVGSLYLDELTPALYQQVVPGANAAFVQAKNSLTASVTLASAPTVGDTLVAVCWQGGTVNTSGGWTDAGLNHSPAVFDLESHVGYKVAGSGESASQTPCVSGYTSVFELSGVTWSASFEGWAHNAANTGGQTTTVSYTTTNANDLVIGSYAIANGGTVNSLAVTGTVTANPTTLYGVNPSSQQTGLGTTAQSFASAGGQTATATFNAGQAATGVLIALKPATGSYRRIDATGTVSTTGSPASGNLAKFSGSTSVTNGDLSGDISTSGTLVTTIGAGKVTEAMQVLANNTTNNVSTSKHGYVPILPNDATKYLDGTGAFSVPAGGGGGGTTTIVTGLPVISETVTSGSQTSVTISSIPSTYRDLKVVVTGRSTAATTGENLIIYFNGDSTSGNYAAQFQQANTTTLSGATSVNRLAGFLPGASATANQAGVADILVPAYSSTTFIKQWLSSSGTPGYPLLRGTAGRWNATTAISSLTVAFDSGAAFTDGTIVTVYGVGGSVTPTLPMVAPQGRLTLTSASPVMTADATAQTSIYYAPYQGNQITIGGVSYLFSQITYALNSTAHVSGNLYDIFGYNNAGTPALCTGPAWTNSTTRSAAISMTSGLWYNSATLTCNLTGGTTTTSIAAGAATYLGTFYATANGQTGMAFKPTGASGGANNILGLFNAYNRVRVMAINRDSAADYTYNSLTWRTANASSSNRISWVDGLQQSALQAFSSAIVYSNAVSGVGYVGTVIDSTSATPSQFNGGGSTITSTITVGGGSIVENFLPLLGFHYAQRMEHVTVGTATWSNSAISVALEMHLPLVVPLAVFRRRKRGANDNEQRSRKAA